MSQSWQWRFEPYRLDLSNACLWRGEARVALPPKPFAVLTHLIMHAGQLVTKEALLDAVWPDVTVTDTVLKVCMSQIRKALGDSAKTPRFVATVHRLGYRFIAPVTAIDTPLPPSTSARGDATAPVVDAALTQAMAGPTMVLVEREAVLNHLTDCLQLARQGTRQAVFLTGEAGIGKTTVIDAFITHNVTGQGWWYAQGQCLEHYGPGEPYQPVLEALDRLCQGPDGERVVTLLRQHAPTWLVQMPWLLRSEDREVLQPERLGRTRERMLRELIAALETLAAERPLVLVLEDLHWSDYATLDLIAGLARRREPAQLLVLGTYRPVETIVYEHPLRQMAQTLTLHEHSVEHPLSLLSQAAVSTYLAKRFPHHCFPEELAAVLYHRTDGNPLFLTLIVASWLSQGMLDVRDGQWELQASLDAAVTQVPQGLQVMIKQEFDRVSPYQLQTLETASVVGVAFAVSVVAIAMGKDADQVEQWCAELAQQQQFLRPMGLDTWPDGTVTARYGFTHSLYQHVVYQCLSPGRRVHLHQRIGTCLETAYETRTSEIAVELARHFTQAYEAHRAIPFLHQAAENAMCRYAPREANEHLTTGLDLLCTLPETPQRDQQEFELLLQQHAVLMMLTGLASPEVAQVMARIEALYPQVEEIPHLAMRSWMELWVWYLQRIDTLETAKEVAERWLLAAQCQDRQEHVLKASNALGLSLLVLGAPTLARQHVERALSVYDPAQHKPAVIHTVLATTQDPGVSSLCWMAWMWWMLGYPDQAIQRCQEALTLAQRLAHPYSEAFALGHVARHHLYRGEYCEAQERAEAQMTLATQQEFQAMVRQSTMLRGAALAFQGQIAAGIGQIRQLFETQFGVSTTFFPRELAALADVYRRIGQPSEGLKLIHQALAIVAQSESHYHEAELYRLKGELVLRQCPPDEQEAEQYFLRALDIAQRQESKAWELRSSVSLGRLWQAQDKQEEARNLLTPVYGWFTEGFNTVDLQEAQSLLAKLGT